MFSSIETPYPTLLPAPNPRLLTYPKETVVAEKFEARLYDLRSTYATRLIEVFADEVADETGSAGQNQSPSQRDTGVLAQQGFGDRGFDTVEGKT